MKYLIASTLVFCLTIPAISADKTPMTTAEMDMMKKFQEAATPGEAHARLKVFEGNWKAKVQNWMKPGDKAQESEGSAVFSFALDGRYLKQDFSGQWAGKPFMGLGYVGYDNIRKEYTNVWMDSMSTGMAIATGQFDDKSKAIKDQGTFACPMTGEKQRWFRSDWGEPSNNSFTYTMYSKDEKGQEFKSMEITYTRAK